jgi:hypothetical protein
MISGTNYRTLASSAKVTHIAVTSGGCLTTVADANYVATIYDELIGYSTLTTGRTVTIPDPTLVGATTQSPKRMGVQDESGNALASNITVVSAGGATINGAANALVNSAYGFMPLFTQGTAWFVGGW